MANLKSYYLNQLGIDEWVERQAEESQAKLSPADNLNALATCVARCTKCPLSQSRTQTVFARGNPKASLMIIGEAPGFNEDKQGLPFVGRSGSLLNQMLHSINLTEDDVYIVNVVKCRPPENRDPRVEELKACSDYLAQQIHWVAPKLLVGVGRFAGQYLTSSSLPLNKMRGHIGYYNATPFVVSYHPAYLLRRPTDKKKAYEDLIYIKNILDDKINQ